MGFSKSVQSFAARYLKVSTYAAVLGGVCVLVIMVYTTADVTGRYLFNKPIPGSFEVGQLLMVFVVFLGLAYAQALGRHLRIEVFFQRASPRGQFILDMVALFIGLGLFSITSWQAANYALEAWQKHEEMQGLWSIPQFPGKLGFAIGVFALCVQYVIDIIRRINKYRKAPGEP